MYNACFCCVTHPTFCLCGVRLFAVRPHATPSASTITVAPGSQGMPQTALAHCPTAIRHKLWTSSKCLQPWSQGSHESLYLWYLCTSNALGCTCTLSPCGTSGGHSRGAYAACRPHNARMRQQMALSQPAPQHCYPSRCTCSPWLERCCLWLQHINRWNVGVCLLELQLQLR